MPLFHFKMLRGGGTVSESTLELMDDHAAWEEATIFAGETLKDIDGSLRKGGDLRIEVGDASKAPLFTIRVSSIVHTGNPTP